MSGPAAPFVAIGGTLISLFSELFGNNGPSKEEQMIQAVSKQIEQLSEYIGKQFSALADHIDRRIGELAKHVDKRFDRLEGILNNFYKGVMEQFFLVRQDIQYLNICIKKINQKMENLQSELASDFYQIYKQPYDKLIIALEYHTKYPYPEYQLSEREVQKHYDKFVQWATTGSKNELVAGKAKDDIDAAALCQRVIDSGSINKNINAIVAYAVKNFGVKNPGVLINPDVWTKAASDLLTFINRTPELKLLVTYEIDIEKIKNAGEQYNQFKMDMKKDPNVLNKLLANYTTKLKDVCTIISNNVKIKIAEHSHGPLPGPPIFDSTQNMLQIVVWYSKGKISSAGIGGSKTLTDYWNEISNSKVFDLALNELATAYQLLVIYIATIFSEDYLTNNWLRDALAYLPVEKQTFQNYFKNIGYIVEKPPENSLLAYLLNIQTLGKHPYKHHIKLDQQNTSFITPQLHARIISSMFIEMFYDFRKNSSKTQHDNNEVENIIEALELFKQSHSFQMAKTRANMLQVSKFASYDSDDINDSGQQTTSDDDTKDDDEIYVLLKKLSGFRKKLSVTSNIEEKQTDDQSYETHHYLAFIADNTEHNTWFSLDEAVIFKNLLLELTSWLSENQEKFPDITIKEFSYEQTSINYVFIDFFDSRHQYDEFKETLDQLGFRIEKITHEEQAKNTYQLNPKKSSNFGAEQSPMRDPPSKPISKQLKNQNYSDKTRFSLYSATKKAPEKIYTTDRPQSFHLFKNEENETKKINSEILQSLSKAKIIAEDNNTVLVIFPNSNLAKQFQTEAMKYKIYNSGMWGTPRKPEVMFASNDNSGDQFIFTLTSSEFNKINNNADAYNNLLEEGKLTDKIKGIDLY